MFVRSRKKPVKPAAFVTEFYIYLIKQLNHEYKEITLPEYNGIPSKEAITSVSSFFETVSKEKAQEIIKLVMSSQARTQVEKHIYSTYKAASYFVNLAKSKFELVDKKNRLTNDGKNLLSIRSGFFQYSAMEKIFFFSKIIEKDFLIFISLCSFLKSAKQYGIKDYVSFHFDFLDKFYSIKHFNFTSASLRNFNTVRTYWLETLKILDTNNRIKKRYREIIGNNPLYKTWDEEITQRFKSYEREHFREARSYIRNRNLLEKIFKALEKRGKGDLGFVNLYDLKKGLRLSEDRFEAFINKYYEQEKTKKFIFFNNIVSSIDRRKRFMVRGVPVIKMKIKL